MIFRIRPAQLSDIDAIRALTVDGAPGVSAFEPNELEWAFEQAEGIWVATANDRVLGYVLTFGSQGQYNGEEFQWFQKNYGSFLYIDRVAIAAGARGRGIGKGLYAQVTEFAQQHEYARLVCEVNLEPPNPNSMSFHTALGFSQLGIWDTHDGRQVALLSCPVPHRS